MVVPVCEQVKGCEWVMRICPVVLGMSTGSLIGIDCVEFLVVHDSVGALQMVFQ